MGCARNGSCDVRGELSLVRYCSSFSSHFFTERLTWHRQYNFLMTNIPEPPKDEQLLLWLLRLAFIGFIASVVSDSVSNSLRVVKTYRQVNDVQVGYCASLLLCCSPLVFFQHSVFGLPSYQPGNLRPALTHRAVRAAHLVILSDGVIGLFGRGLKTRILCNGLQGLLFSILWKLFSDL